MSAVYTTHDILCLVFYAMCSVCVLQFLTLYCTWCSSRHSVSQSCDTVCNVDQCKSALCVIFILNYIWDLKCKSILWTLQGSKLRSTYLLL